MKIDQSPQIYVDFDRTLFDTDAFGLEFIAWLAQQSGRNTDQVRHDIDAHKTTADDGVYDFSAHIAEYGLSAVDAEQQLTNIIQAGDWVFADADNFLQSMRQKGANLSILSFGQTLFQEIKIRAALGDYVSEGGWLDVVVTQQPKHLYIVKHAIDAGGALIDDIAGQSLPPNYAEIHIDRSNTSDRIDTSREGVVAVSSLAQAGEYLTHRFFSV